MISRKTNNNKNIYIYIYINDIYVHNNKIAKSTTRREKLKKKPKTKLSSRNFSKVEHRQRIIFTKKTKFYPAIETELLNLGGCCNKS